MSAQTLTATCGLCGAGMDNSASQCPRCHASNAWQDYARAFGFALVEVAGWANRGLISPNNQLSEELHLKDELAKIAPAAKEGNSVPSFTGMPSAQICWRCSRPVAAYYSYCNTCGAILGEPADKLRYLKFLLNEITRASARELTLSQAHACAADVREHIAALRAQIDQQGLSPADLTAQRVDHLKQIKTGSSAQAQRATPPPIPVAAQMDPTIQLEEIPSAPPAPRHSILEILLDPRSIQWLLASGGVLLVVGLVIGLASLGIFKDPLVIAGCMGAGTIVLLGSGSAVFRFTRYKLAGRAIALLACLVMPLNLWFYERHGLLTLDGHLWAAAVVCCVLYVIAAGVLEDAVFIYVLCAGVALTGMLILADMQKLMEVASPATLLMALGLLALHAERAFATNDGPFSRKKFGMACFWSAQVLIGLGLVLLLAAQIAGFLPTALNYLPSTPDIVTDSYQRLLAIALVLAGTYAYIYSDLVVRKIGVYVYIAAFTLLWAELLAIDYAHLSNHPSALIAALAVTSLVVNLVASFTTKTGTENSSKFSRPLPTFGLLLAIVPVFFGLLLHLRATRADIHQNWPYTVTWAYVGAMILTAICCRISAFLSRHRDARLSGGYLGATAAATIVGAAGLLTMLSIKAWPEQSVILMIIPILYLIASQLYRGHTAQRPLLLVAQAATGVMILSVLFSALNITQHVEPITDSSANLILALFWGEAALFYAIAAMIYGVGFNVYAATAMACGTLWQLLNYWNCPAEYYCITYAALGISLLISYRMALLDRLVRPQLVKAAYQSGNALLSISFAAAALMSLSRMAFDLSGLSQLNLLGAFALLAILAAILVRQPGFRRWYITVAIIQTGLAFIDFQLKLNLNPWQHFEFFCVAVGLVLLAAGHISWYREQQRHSDSASFCLFFGAVLAGVPLAIAALINRFGYDISLIDEIGLLTISVLMFISGFMFRLRSTTLVGGSLLAVHLIMLMVFAGMKAQLAVGVYLAMGGTCIFGLGLVLSIYRDRLLTLPSKIRSREGVFGVLAWR